MDEDVYLSEHRRLWEGGPKERYIVPRRHRHLTQDRKQRVRSGSTGYHQVTIRLPSGYQ